MNIVIVGCGYVSDFYLQTLPNHPELTVCGVYDHDPIRLARFAKHNGLNAYRDLESVLEDRAVDIVVNLTNPRSHYEISKACLEAGKHVYSEKPLGMNLAEVRELTAISLATGVRIACAPCNLLSESAQTMWRHLREGRIGRVRLAYAELDDGMVHKAAYRSWISESGSPWPFKNEFETGCTLEHADYYLTWLCAFFGPAKRITAFSSVQIPDKVAEVAAADMAPDFSVGCIEFENGVVARLTCGIIAPGDHSIRIIGDDGVLTVSEAWDFGSPVRLRAMPHGLPGRIASRVEREIKRRSPAFLLTRNLPLVRPARFKRPTAFPMDFARGVAELGAAVRENRPCRLSPEFCLHVAELTLVLHNPELHERPYTVQSRFEPVEPMAWAA